MVPGEVRRLFQVLTGEDMTDADEDALFAVVGALESGAATVEVLGPVVRDVVGRVRVEFSGKAADRFTARLDRFVPALEAGSVGLRELAGFVENLALQVQYLKFVTVGGLLLLLAEIAWAVAMAGPTAGASMAWLAARFAVMRFLLTRWWGQLFVRLAVAQVVGMGLQLLVEVGAQGAQFALGTRKKWDGQLTTMAVGVGSFSALLAVPLSALGNVVGNAITKVLVRGLGDKIDAEVLAAAAKHAVEEHAEQYPLSSMARFADVVSKNIEDFTGMSVRAMWAARFGHGLGESLEEGLTEMFGEAGYGALSGQGAQWNPFSFTAGLSEAVGSGIGNLAGLALRGQLIPAGRARDAAGGEKDSSGTDTDTDTDTSADLKVDFGSQAGEKPSFREALSERSGSTGGVPDTEKAPDTEKVALGKPSVVAEGEESGAAKKDVPDLSPSWGVPSLGGLVHGASIPEPRVARSVDGVATPGDEPRGVDAGAGAGQDSPASMSERTDDTGVVVSWRAGDATAPGALRGQDTPPPYSPPRGDDLVRSGSPVPGGRVIGGDSDAVTPPLAYSRAVGDGHGEIASSNVDNHGDYPSALTGSEDRVTVSDSPQRDGHADAAESGMDSPAAPADGVRVETTTQVVDSQLEKPLPGSTDEPDSSSVAVVSETSSPVAGTVPHPDGGTNVQGFARGSATVPGASVGVDPHASSVAGETISARPSGGLPDSSMPMDTSSRMASSSAPITGRAGLPVGLPEDAVLVTVPAEGLSDGGVAEFVRGRAGDVNAGPVVLVSGDRAGAGVVVSPGQAAEAARSAGRDVVALMPGRDRSGPQWVRFGADGSSPRPVGGAGSIEAPKQAGGLHVVANSSTVIPEGAAQKAVPGAQSGPETASADADFTATGTVVSEAGHAGERPGSTAVAEWTESDLRREVELAQSVGGPRAAAVRIVQGTHDVVYLARGESGISLDEVVALVAARAAAVGRAEAERFSRELAAKLGTRGTGLAIQGGAGPYPQADASVPEGRAPVVEVSERARLVSELRMSVERVRNELAANKPRLREISAENGDSTSGAVDSAGGVPTEVAASADVAAPERSQLVSELMASVESLRQLVVDASAPYAPELRARMEWWSDIAQQPSLQRMEVGALRNETQAAAAAVGMVRRARRDAAVREMNALIEAADAALLEVTDRQGPEALLGLFAIADELLGGRAAEPLRLVMAHQVLRAPDDRAAAEAMRQRLHEYLAASMSVSAGAGPEAGGGGGVFPPQPRDEVPAVETVRDVNSMDAGDALGQERRELLERLYMLMDAGDDDRASGHGARDRADAGKRPAQGPSPGSVDARGAQRRRSWPILWPKKSGPSGVGGLLSKQTTSESATPVAETGPMTKTKSAEPSGRTSENPTIGKDAPGETAGARTKPDGDDPGRPRLRLPGYLRRSASLGPARQLSRTVGTDQVVAAAGRLLPDDSDKDGLDALKQAVSNEVGTLLGYGREFRVGDAKLWVRAEFDWTHRVAADGPGAEQSATTMTESATGAGTKSAGKPNYRQIFFIPAVPGMMAFGAVNLPTGTAVNRATDRVDTNKESMTIALPDKHVSGGDTEYAGTRAVRVPVRFHISRLDDEGRSSTGATIVGGEGHPGAGPVGVELSVPTGLRSVDRGRAVPVPAELPPSVLEGTDVRHLIHGQYQGKPVRIKTAPGQVPAIYDQVAAQFGALGGLARDVLRHFLSQSGIEHLLPRMAVSQQEAAAGRGWVSSEPLLPSGNPLKRMLSTRVRFVQMRAVAREVAYLEKIDNASLVSSSKGGATATSQHGAGREVSGSVAGGPGVAVGPVIASAAPYVGGSVGRSHDQQFAHASGRSDAAASNVTVVRYRTVYDLQVRTPGRPPITFPEAVDAIHWTVSQFAREAGLINDDNQPHPHRVAGITGAALAASGAGAKLAQILRDSARTIPGHHRWAWRDTAFVADFDDPKLAGGIKAKKARQLARGEQIDTATSSDRLSSPRVAEEMLADQATVVELVEHGRGHDYHASLALAAEVRDVKDLGPIDEAAATATLTDSETVQHSTGVTWSAEAGFVARIYSVLAGETAVLTSYHKVNFARGKSSATGENTELSFGGARGNEPTATGRVGPEPRKRLAYRVRYKASGTHWQEWNTLAKGVTIGRPGMHTPPVRDLRIVDRTAAAEGREPGVVDVDIVVDLPAWQAEKLKTELIEIKKAAVEPVGRSQVPHDDETTRRGFSRVFDGMPIVSLHGMKHLRESAFKQLRELSGHSSWQLGDNGRLVDSGMSLATVRGNPRSLSKKFRLDGLFSPRRRRDQHGAVEYSLLLRDPTPVLDAEGKPVKVWQQPTHSVTGGRSTYSGTTSTVTFGNSIEPAMIPISDFSAQHGPNTSSLTALGFADTTLWAGSSSRKRGQVVSSSHTRSVTGKPRELHLVEVNVEATVATEVRTVGKIDRVGLLAPKPAVRSAERFTLPRAGTVLVTDEQLQEIRTKQAEVDAQRARNAAGGWASPVKPPSPSADVVPVPAGHALAAPSWSGGVTEAVDLTDRIPLLHEKVSRSLGAEQADRLLPSSARDTAHDNYREVERFLSNVQAKMGDAANGGASTPLRLEDRFSGRTYELHVGAKLRSEPVAEGITHGELVTGSAASILSSSTRRARRVLLETFGALIPAVHIDGSGPSGPVSDSGEPGPFHGPLYVKAGLGIAYGAAWLKQVRTRTRTAAENYTNSERVSGALASHRAEVLFDVRLERHGQRIAEAPDVRTVGVRTAVEDTVPAEVAARPRTATLADRPVSEAADEAVRRWRSGGNAEKLPAPGQFRAVEFTGKVEDLVAAAERAITAAGGGVNADVRRALRAWFSPHRLEALLGRLADPHAQALLVDLPPQLGVDVAVHLRIPDRGTLTSTSGRISMGGSMATPETEYDEVSTGGRHVLSMVPLIAGGVSHPKASDDHEKSDKAFASAGGWNLPLFALGTREYEGGQSLWSESAGKKLPDKTADSPLKGITSTWMHGAEFRIVASPGKYSVGKQTAVVDAGFEAGYVIRRGDRGIELPAALVSATKEFAERGAKWTDAIDQERAARVTLSQATAAELQAKVAVAEQERREATARKLVAKQRWSEAMAREQAAQRAWWQAKRTYELELAIARTEPTLAGAPADARVTVGEDAPSRVRARHALYPVMDKVLEARRQGYQPRVRYVVHGDLNARDDNESQAKKDFSYVANELKDKLRIAQWNIPEDNRFGPSDVGLVATPQFLPAEGPTRVEIWIDVRARRADLAAAREITATGTAGAKDKRIPVPPSLQSPFTVYPLADWGLAGGGLPVGPGQPGLRGLGTGPAVGA
ncbi:WXG100-like domain-containing protein [Saccharopolyspora phatthalungensis]